MDKAPGKLVSGSTVMLGGDPSGQIDGAVLTYADDGYRTPYESLKDPGRLDLQLPSRWKGDTAISRCHG